MAAILPLFSGLSATGLVGLSTTLSVAGSAFGIFTSLAAANSAAAVARNNAKIAEQNAQTAIQTAQVQAQEQDIRARAEMGKYLSEMGASGLDLASQSIQLKRRSQQELAAKDRGFIRYEGNVQARNYRTQADDFRYQAQQSIYGGLYDAVDGAINIGSSLISGAYTVNRLNALASF